MELKASDLRIGNLIAFGKQCCKVYEIQENCFYVIGEKERSFKSTSFKLEPIKLNHNLLIKLIIFFDDNYRFEIKGNRTTVYFNEKYLTTLEYLHELQNLYFTLTGSELTVA